MTLELKPRKRIGLVAHDNKKQDLIEWARYNRRMLAMHDLVATGTTGTMLERELELPVTCLQSGPLGGDLQIGAMIADGSIDFLVFFWDPLEPQASRHGRQVAAADRGRVEHPCRLRPGLGRLHDLVTADDRVVRANGARLHGPQGPRASRGRRDRQAQRCRPGRGGRPRRGRPGRGGRPRRNLAPAFLKFDAGRDSQPGGTATSP